MGKKHKKHKSEKRSQPDTEEIQKEPIYTKEKSDKPPALKLVLKVGGAQSETIKDIYSHSPHEERKHKHHKKKKKKKDKDKERHRHSEESGSSKRKSKHAEPEESENTQPDEPPAKVPALEPVVDKEEESMDVGEPTETVDVIKDVPNIYNTQEGDHGAALRECLHYLHRTLQKKDVNGFFAFPVTDAIAPGYSSIIHYAMDFSTLNHKIENEEFSGVMDFKKDFVTMCNNAVTYNRPETIYYKEAKKLLHSGLKLMSKEKLMNMKKMLPFMGSVTNEELGVDDNVAAPAEMVAIIDEEEQRMKELKRLQKAKNCLSRFEAVPDNLTADEILAQAQAAAKEAKEELTLRKPQCHFGFLNRRNDGSTTMSILNPDNDGLVSETEKIVSLGELTGKVTMGSGSLAGFKEDKRNKVSLVTYLNYGPFSSYAPQYDASFANVSKEESDILLSAYGDETGIQYAKSVSHFVKDADDYAIKMVDNLLDILTRGEHSKSKQVIAQRKLLEEEKKTQEKDKTVSSKEDTRDVSKDAVVDPLQQRLDQTAGLIQDLQQTQLERLSACPPSHLGLLPGPSEKEAQLKERVSKELQALAKEAVPRDLISVTAVRQTMGITTNPVNSISNLTETQPTQQTSQTPVQTTAQSPSF
ncbi:bromodomain-containing protein 7-like [Gigantopelta aegis]|uniref:bromodomain-containing protein 7-like n=1 Tax=Gigantopelta aegis TaxID=1735272 RepID=UPI001B887B11|nr:bromodomain-containing protein 7-like [Gigantopelta aegis]